MSEFSESESDLDSLPEMSRRSSLRSDQSHDPAQSQDFFVDATGDILDGLENGVLPENMSLELVGLRTKENASQHQVRQAVVTAFMKRTSDLMHGDGRPGLSAGDAVRQVFTNYMEIIQKTLFDQSAEIKSDQVDFLLLLQKDAVGREGGDTLFLIITKELYDLELVEEDCIIQWWEDDRSSHGDMAKARPKMKQFIDFLENAEEESD
jgi:translation initiation factor eIF-2B subunit epsilon